MTSWTVVRKTWLSRQPSSGAWLVTVLSLAALFAGAFLHWYGPEALSSLMPASGEKVFSQHQYWRLWSALFAHADLGHLLSNSMLFAVFGYFLSGYFGVRVFPVLALLMGGATNVIVLSHYPPSISLLGMSGVVYWMGGFWLVLYLLLDLPRSLTQRLLRSFGVALAVFMPSATFDPQISYGAHLIGFILGVISGGIYYLFRRKYFEAAVVRETIVEEEDPRPRSQSMDEAIALGFPHYRTIRSRGEFEDGP